MSFSARFALVFAAGVAAAIVLSPLAAAAVAAAGFQFPFPRIFDRTVMGTLLIAILLTARAFKLGEHLMNGFARPAKNAPRALGGFAVAIAAIGVLVVLAVIVEGPGTLMIAALADRAVRYLPAAILIAIIEEGFFRAFLLDGMKSDFGRRGAIVASSVVYALAHLVRSPAHLYVSGLQPAAGARNVIAVLAQFADPRLIIPPLIGLFLIGLVLGAAFVLTSTVYFSIGIHAGLIVGLKSWPAIVPDRSSIPGWLFGSGRFPLVSGAAAWAIAILLLAMIRPLTRARRE